MVRIRLIEYDGLIAQTPYIPPHSIYDTEKEAEDALREYIEKRGSCSSFAPLDEGRGK